MMTIFERKGCMNLLFAGGGREGKGLGKKRKVLPQPRSKTFNSSWRDRGRLGFFRTMGSRELTGIG